MSNQIDNKYSDAEVVSLDNSNRLRLEVNSGGVSFFIHDDEVSLTLDEAFALADDIITERITNVEIPCQVTPEDVLTVAYNVVSMRDGFFTFDINGKQVTIHEDVANALSDWMNYRIESNLDNS